MIQRHLLFLSQTKEINSASQIKVIIGQRVQSRNSPASSWLIQMRLLIRNTSIWTSWETIPTNFEQAFDATTTISFLNFLFWALPILLHEKIKKNKRENERSLPWWFLVLWIQNHL